MTRYLVLLAVMPSLCSSAASAYTAQACVKIQVTYTDSDPTWTLTNGVKEDNWKEQTRLRPPYGASYLITRGGTAVASGNLGDGFAPGVPAGCTANFEVPASVTHIMWVWSEGLVQSNHLVSQAPNRSSRIAAATFIPTATPFDVNITLVGSDDHDTEVLSDVFYAYVAGSYALFRHAGGEVGNWYYYYRCDCAVSGSSCVVAGNQYGDCSCAGTPPDGCYVEGGNKTNQSLTNPDGTWWVSSMKPEGDNTKFMLIHELGHQLAHSITNGNANGGNCNYAGGHPCDAAGSGAHAMWSVENANCAYDEAFANFYSADVWNSHSQQDCAYKYSLWNIDTQYTWQLRHGPMIDCAADDGPDPGTARDDFTNGQNAEAAHPMEASWFDKCPDPSMSYVSTEVDWTRVFWGIHTDGASPPSFTAIGQWLRDCGPVGVDTAYWDLDACAENAPGTLNANWNANVPATGHNIDQ
ncbi:MAG: hypothetical protein HYS27_08365 [Deltaproteobacteria bacterium]|nr:hypothetical protein [Deltaproteobacteria bacterium]